MCVCICVQMYQKTGSLAVTGMRSLFDFLTGYGPHMTEVRGSIQGSCVCFALWANMLPHT